MKLFYESPQIEIFNVSAVDVASSSGGLDNGGDGNDNSGLHIDLDDIFGGSD